MYVCTPLPWHPKTHHHRHLIVFFPPIQTTWNVHEGMGRRNKKYFLAFIEGQPYRFTTWCLMTSQPDNLNQTTLHPDNQTQAVRGWKAVRLTLSVNRTTDKLLKQIILLFWVSEVRLSHTGGARDQQWRRTFSFFHSGKVWLFFQLFWHERQQTPTWRYLKF